jgi:hypothetical protein
MTSVDDSNEENISNERCPRESTYHRANLNRRVPYNSHVCDSGGTDMKLCIGTIWLFSSL